MRVITWPIALFAAVAFFAKSSIADETDEFGDLEPEEVKPTPYTPQDPTRLVSFGYPGHDGWVLEIVCAAVAVVFTINYFVGRSRNKSIAEKCVDECEPELAKQFAYTGYSAAPRVGLLEESNSNFKYYCTGRRFCSRFILDLDLAARMDLFSVLTSIVISRNDYLSLDIGMNESDMDPMVIGICKTREFNDFAKSYPQVLSQAKRLEASGLPSSLCIAADHIELPKTLLSKQFQSYLTELEPFLEHIMITDMNEHKITGMPTTEEHVMRLRFKMSSGGKQLDPTKAVELGIHLVDALGSTVKLSRDAKFSAKKRRTKMKQEKEAKAAKEEEAKEAEQKRLAELKEKKQKEYESLSYEEQAKRDALHQKKMKRKQLSRKAK